MGERSDVTTVLVRAAIDPEFRDLVRRAPEEALRDYDLSDEDEATLRAGDAGMLRLLAAAVREVDPGTPAAAPAPADAAPAPADAAPAPPPPAAPEPVPLPPLALTLHIQPFAAQTPEGLRISCAVSMQPLQAAAPPAAEPAAATRPTSEWTAWDHDLDSDATRDAASAVLASAPGQRRERILALLRSMTSRERIGGTSAGRA
jgi:hypothetical protein